MLRHCCKAMAPRLWRKSQTLRSAGTGYCTRLILWPGIVAIFLPSISRRCCSCSFWMIRVCSCPEQTHSLALSACGTPRTTSVDNGSGDTTNMPHTCSFQPTKQWGKRIFQPGPLRHSSRSASHPTTTVPMWFSDRLL